MVIDLIKYPDGIIKSDAKRIKVFGNRGMSLEEDLNLTNNYYLEKDIAIVYKKPTPIQVVEQKNEKIVKAFFKEPSTTDYNGIYKGKYIDFEAKETTSKTSFPLSNIHNHQIKHIRNILNHKGICFLIVRFTILNKTFLLFGEDFIKFIDKETRKSIPLSYFLDKGHEIEIKLNPRVDYIKLIDKYGGI